MKQLLRSMFVHGPDDDRAAAFHNYRRFVEVDLAFEEADDQAIWTYLHNFYRTNSEAPDLESIRAHFSMAGEISMTDYLEELRALKPAYGGNFTQKVEQKAQDRRVRLVEEALTESSTILTKGIVDRNKKGEERKLFGPFEAVNRFMERAQKVVAPTFGGNLTGEIIHDTETFRERYLRVESDPFFGVGYATPLDRINEYISGARRKELWIHAAFSGGLKSTLALNWAHYQAIYRGNTSQYFSLEMPKEQCHNIMVAMHSAMPVPREHRMAEGRLKCGLAKTEADLVHSPGLDYSRLRDAKLYRPDGSMSLQDVGNLPANERRFLFDYVLADMEEGRLNVPKCDMYPNGASIPYGKVHIEVADPDKNDFTVLDMKAKAQLLRAKEDFQLIFVDYAGLMSPRPGNKSSSRTDQLNEVMRDLKKLALSFNRGEGMAVVSLFQLSREGYKRAVLRKEKCGVPLYLMSDLSYANECERSADIITSTFVDDEYRANSEALVQCLKTRDDAPFPLHKIGVRWNHRVLLSRWDEAGTDLVDATPSDIRSSDIATERDGRGTADDLSSLISATDND